MANLPPLNSLRCFMVVAKHLSFKKAAEQLFITQAAVSQQIRTLEKNLDVCLFDRSNRQVKLTTVGFKLLPYVNQGFDAFETGINQLAIDLEPEQLTVSVLPSFASRWLMPRIISAQKAMPGINIRLDPSSGMTDFSRSDVDIGIRYGQGKYEGLKSELLINDWIYPVCHPDYLPGLQIDQLHESLIFDDQSVDAYGWKRYFRDQGLLEYLPVNRIEINDTGMMIEALLGGEGVGLVRHSLVYKLIESGSLVQPFSYRHFSNFAYYLVAPDHHFKREKVMLFKQWLQKTLRDEGL